MFDESTNNREMPGTTQVDMADRREESSRTPTPDIDKDMLDWRNSVIFAEEDNSCDSEVSTSIEKSDLYDSPEQVKSAIHRDVAFIKSHAPELDSDVLYSLLLSQVENPDRLESIMCDILAIPGARELLGDRKTGTERSVDKRAADSLSEDPSNKKKMKMSEHSDFVQTIQDMFPDAHEMFLKGECQHMKNWEECSRFINTVMITGVYPKEGESDWTWNRPTDVEQDARKGCQAINGLQGPIFLVSSDDESQGPDLKIEGNNELAVDFPLGAPVILGVKNSGLSGDSTDLEPHELTLSRSIAVSVGVPRASNSSGFSVSSTSSTSSASISDIPIPNSVLPVEVKTSQTSTDLDSSTATETADWADVIANEIDALLNDEVPVVLPPFATALQPVNKIKTASTLPSLAPDLDDATNIPLPRLFDFFQRATGLGSTHQPRESLASSGDFPSRTATITTTTTTTTTAAAAAATTTTTTTITTTATTTLPLFNPHLPPTCEQRQSGSVVKATPPTSQAMAPRPKAALPTLTNETTRAKTVEPKPGTSKTSVLNLTVRPDDLASSISQSELAVPVPVQVAKADPNDPKPGTSQSGLAATQITFQTDVSGEANPETAQAEKPNEEEWVEEQTANLIRIFPKTDPSFLRAECSRMKCSSEAVNEFVISKLEKNDMPTREEYEKRLEMEKLQNRYTKNFNIQDFLKAVPEPWVYFNKKRNCFKYRLHSVCYLKSTFRRHYMKDINEAMRVNEDNLYKAYQHLKSLEKTSKLRARRGDLECNKDRPIEIDIQFLQEVAFIENEQRIKQFIEGEKEAKKKKFEEAKSTGTFLECQCCYDCEVLVEDVFYCPNDHAFCKECIIKSVEVEMGNGKSQFACLAGCNEKLSLSTLQVVLKAELFSKVIQANQMEEIKAAGIEDLVQCPFCNYATIMPPEQRVVTCLNPECLKESCRLCKELNHIPLRCDEVEKSEEVKMRTYIENKMTEALVRTCYTCNKKFVKEDGCNKMTCTCGAKMCYICRQPVEDYKHFRGQGADKDKDKDKCPLYSTNDELHVDAVMRVAEKAKAEILHVNPEKRLLHDPTAIQPKRLHDRPMPGMNIGPAELIAQQLNLPARIRLAAPQVPYFPPEVNYELWGQQQQHLIHAQRRLHHYHRRHHHNHGNHIGYHQPDPRPHP